MKIKKQERIGIKRKEFDKFKEEYTEQEEIIKKQIKEDKINAKGYSLDYQRKARDNEKKFQEYKDNRRKAEVEYLKKQDEIESKLAEKDNISLKEFHKFISFCFVFLMFFINVLYAFYFILNN